MMEPASRFTDLPAYTPIEPFEVLSSRLGRPVDEIVKLDANENPYGPSPKVRQALADLEFPHIYPDPESRKLRSALAEFTGIPMANLMAGSGADELIDLILRVMLEKDDRVIICPPTFGMYAFDTGVNSGKVIEVPRHQDFSLDLASIQAILAKYNPKVIFLTSPNNPDGNLLKKDELNAILELPVLVVIDEAYIEFADQGGILGEKQSQIIEVLRRNILIVLRTFSKWAGLAGLRVGYGAFPDWLMPILWKAKQPYNVNVAASTAAIVSIEDAPYLAEIVSRIKSERARLFKQLQKVPFLHPHPSQANFILCQVNQPFSAYQLKKSLMDKGILVRYYDTPYLRNFIRISVGKPEQSEILLTTLSDLSSVITR
jgi:histidinol-phosphate aminotransferase